jgi:hypothetical protein
MIDSCTYIHIQVSVLRDITLECLQITPTKFRGSKFPGNMHNHIWCPYYLPSFMKFCSVVSEELCWQAASEVYFGKLDQRGITPTKFRESKFPGNMHNCIWCPYYLPSFMKFCSVVSEELYWQAASEVYFGKLLSSKGHNSHKI